MPRSLVILSGPQLTDDHFRAVATALAPQQMELANITPLSLHPDERGVTPGGSHPRAQQDAAVLAFEGEALHPHALPDAMRELSAMLKVDVNWLSQEAFLRDIKLAVFDMDSTLIQHEVIDELAIEAGKGVEVAAITEKAMRGEIDFDTSLKYRVKALAGLPECVLDKVADRLTLTPGAKTLIASLKLRDVTTAILSGGFSFFADRVKDRLGMDFYHANRLEIVTGTSGGELTGRVIEPVVNARRKADLLEEIAADHGIPLSQTLAVGDGANDLLMLEKAGIGVAYHAKPKVQEQAAMRINTLGLDAVLYLLGVPENQWAVRAEV